MAAPTLAEMATWARVEEGVEDGPLQLALDMGIGRVRGLLGLASDADFSDDLKVAILTLSLHYFEDRSGVYPEPDILGLLFCYNPVGYSDDDDTTTTS